MMSGPLTRNKQLSTKKPLMMSGFAGQYVRMELTPEWMPRT